MTYKTPRGTRDFIGREMKVRREIINRISDTFDLFCFDEAKTPAFEDFEVLSAKGSTGEEIQDEIYYFKDKSDRELGLRFDFTVPLARIVSSNPALSKPFKRYQIGKVWRYDRPGRGRYREFVQADADIIGVESVRADAEAIFVIFKAMERLSIDNYKIRINSRKIAEGIILQAGVNNEMIDEVFRSMDKLAKVGEEEVRDELSDKGISIDSIDKIMNLISLEGTNDKIIDQLEEEIDNEIGLQGVEEIKNILNLIEEHPSFDKVSLDLSIVRGLQYYTGFIFETEILQEDVGSVCSGGRYDDLIGTFGGDETPAVGLSFGVDRIYDVLEDEINLEESKVFLAIVDDGLKEKGLEIAKELRDKGIKTQVNLSQRNLGNQISYADKKEFRFFLILGQRDFDQSEITLKDLKSGEETKVPLEKTASRIKSMV